MPDLKVVYSLTNTVDGDHVSYYEMVPCNPIAFMQKFPQRVFDLLDISINGKQYHSMLHVIQDIKSGVLS